jgi:hypothetical protein
MMMEFNTRQQRIDMYLVRIHATGMPRAVFTEEFMDLLKEIFLQTHPHGFAEFAVRSSLLLDGLRDDEDLLIKVYLLCTSFQTDVSTNIIEMVTFPHLTFPKCNLVLHIRFDPNVTRTILAQDRHRIAWVMAGMILEKLPHFP